MTDTAALLASVPDRLAWVELRSELLAGATAEVDSGGAVMRGTTLPLLFVVGEPCALLIRTAVEKLPSADCSRSLSPEPM